MPFFAVMAGNLVTVLFCLPWMGGALEFPGSTWLALLFLGTIQLGSAYVLFIVAISRVTAVEGVLLATSEAVFNPIWTMLGTGETPSLAALMGGLLILVSITSYGLLKSTEAHRPASPKNDVQSGSRDAGEG